MDRPRDISGFRSRAINAAYAWTDANRPIGGPGVNVSDAAGGRVVSMSPEGRIPRPRPWDAVAVPDGDGSFDIYIYTAPVLGSGGVAIPYNPAAGGYSALASAGAQVAGNGPGGAPRLSIAAADVADGWLLAEANEGLSAWRLALDPDRSGISNAIPVADITVADDVVTAVRGLHSGAVVFVAIGYPWKVSATADGAGGATLNMSPGAIIADTANGPVLCGGIALPVNQRQISSSGYVVVRIGAADPTSCQVSYAAAVPANTSTYNYIPVAQVTKSGNLYTVSQYLAGAFLAIATVNEEI